MTHTHHVATDKKRVEEDMDDVLSSGYGRIAVEICNHRIVLVSKTTDHKLN